jgi:hypothetical protein
MIATGKISPLFGHCGRNLQGPTFGGAAVDQGIKSCIWLDPSARIDGA